MCTAWGRALCLPPTRFFYFSFSLFKRAWWKKVSASFARNYCNGGKSVEKPNMLSCSIRINFILRELLMQAPKGSVINRSRGDASSTCEQNVWFLEDPTTVHSSIRLHFKQWWHEGVTKWSFPLRNNAGYFPYCNLLPGGVWGRVWRALHFLFTPIIMPSRQHLISIEYNNLKCIWSRIWASAWTRRMNLWIDLMLISHWVMFNQCCLFKNS